MGGGFSFADEAVRFFDCGIIASKYENGVKIVQEYKFAVVFEPCEGGGYHAYCPALRGCHSEGETFEEAKVNITEAIQCYIESLKKDNEPIPEDVDEIVSVIKVSVAA